MDIILIVVFVAAFFFVWFAIWNLIKHPDAKFWLEGQSEAHEPTIDEELNKIKVFLQQEESASVSEVANLLSSDLDEAIDRLELLRAKNLVVITNIRNEEDEVIYSVR